MASGRNSSSRREETGRTERKKKKVNMLPTFAAALVLLIVVAGFFGVVQLKNQEAAEEGETQQGIFFSNQPEFFSTIRPETLNEAEIDPIDDPVLAASYFEKSLFVGTQDVANLQAALPQNPEMGTILEKALFMTANQFTWKNFADEFSGGALTFNLYGSYVSVLGAIESTNAEKIFVQLGREELGVRTVDEVVFDAQVALLSLKQVSPTTEIVVLALTPAVELSDEESEEEEPAESGTETAPMADNTAIDQFNKAMASFCSTADGIRFADVAAVFPAAGLPTRYSAAADDGTTRLNAEGYTLWITKLVDVVSAPDISAPTHNGGGTVTGTPAPAQDTGSSGSNSTAAGRVNVTG